MTEVRLLTKAPELLARLLPEISLMNQAANILQSLRKLAQFDTELRKLSRDTQQYQEMLEKIESQRAPLPTSILVHYDRRTARGKLAIAPVRQGVCGACHLSIPSGRLAELRRKPGELNVCDICGAFIYLTEDEAAAPSKSVSDDGPAKRTLEVKRTNATRLQTKKTRIVARESGSPQKALGGFPHSSDDE